MINITNFFYKIFNVDRFCNVAVAADFLRSGAVTIKRVGAQANDGDFLELDVGFYNSCSFPAI